MSPMTKTFRNLETSDGELLIDLYLTFRCNFDCPYCCSSHDKLRYLEPKDSLPRYKDFITNMAKSKYKTTLCLLGGEPLLYRHLRDIIIHAEKQNFHEIEIYTNGSVSISRLNLEFKNNFTVILSVHPAMYFRYREKIIGNLKYLNSNNVRYKVKLMLERKPRFKVDAYDVYQDLRASGINNIFAGYIEDINTDRFNVTKDSCFDELRNEKTIMLGDSIISQYAFIKMIDGSTKERICYPNEVCVYPDGKISHLCLDTELESRGDHNLNIDVDYFKDFKIPKITCNRVCSYLEQRREF